ncbi:MAG: helix-turn-helix domain-containing protein [Anaerolineae bacterium]
MSSPAEELFNSLNAYAEIEQLIENGEAEGPYLECKSPQSPKLSSGLKAQLAEAVSGFSNSGGGVILWGVSTEKHAHSGLDVLKQIESIGNCRNFARQVDKHIPLLTTPPMKAPPSTILFARKGHAKGVVVTYIPPTPGDPVWSNIDTKFYFRIGDKFSVLPYEMLKRLFAATDSPDLYPLIHDRLITLDQHDQWKIPIVIQNRSSAAVEHVTVSVEIENPSSCQTISGSHPQLRDVSDINPGKRMFMANLTSVVHRGLDIVAGSLFVRMKHRKRALRLTMTIYANKMRAREWHLSMHLTKEGFSIKKTEMEYLY